MRRLKYSCLYVKSMSGYCCSEGCGVHECLFFKSRGLWYNCGAIQVQGWCISFFRPFFYWQFAGFLPMSLDNVSEKFWLLTNSFFGGALDLETCIFVCMFSTHLEGVFQEKLQKYSVHPSEESILKYDLWHQNCLWSSKKVCNCSLRCIIDNLMS